LYGPVPTISLPLLNSSVLAPAASLAGTMRTATRSLGSSGCGRTVLMRSVSGLGAVTLSIGRV